MSENAGIEQHKPGWVHRVFGIESGQLIACDAVRNELGWSRSARFRFLYRGRLGHFYLQCDPRSWEELDLQQAREHFRSLPVQLVPEGEALAAPPEAGA